MTETQPEARTIAELLAAPVPETPSWIYPAVLPRGGKLMFGGNAKAGKSLVAMELARALASADVPFGYPGFWVRDPARVLYLEQELGTYGLQKRSRKIFSDLHADCLAENLWWVSKNPEMKLDSPEGRRIISDLVEQVRPNVLILDPISKFHTAEENSNTEIARVLLSIDRLIAEYRDLELSVIISHHFGKPVRDPRFLADPLDPYNFRGSSNWYGDMDTLGTVARLPQIAGCKHEAWRLRSRWISRHGEAPVKELIFSVNQRDDLRVRFEREVDIGVVVG